ncbi:MAG TPA: hypothetical protein VIT19_05195 [Pyrinomonadaceae bacterium]
MNENPDSDSPSQKTFLPHGFWYIVIVGFVLFALLLWLSRAFVATTEKYTFLVLGGANTLIFLAILVQALIYRRQWDAMQASLYENRKLVAQNERAVKAAEDSVEIGHRAYVLVSSAKPDFSSEQSFIVEFELTNYGNTPANYVRVSHRLELLKEEPKNLKNSSIDWNTPRSSIIAPHSSHPVPYRIKLDISREQYQAFHSKALRLYFWGSIRYRDIFGKIHYSRFRLVHFPGQGPKFGDCQGGNEAD